MKKVEMSKQDKCPHCGAGLDPGNSKTHYACGWPIKPLKTLDGEKWHARERRLNAQS